MIELNTRRGFRVPFSDGVDIPELSGTAALVVFREHIELLRED